MSDLASHRARLRRFPAFFQPILVGADARDRAIACVGALAGIGLTGLLTTLIFGFSLHTPLLFAPLGASAALIFTLPSSPMGQPWPVVAGNTISALAGLLAAQWLHEPLLAAAFAVGLGIAAMSVLRALHPSGGGMALLMALSPSIAETGFGSAMAEVAVSSSLLVLFAYVFHKFSGHPYGPSRRAPAPAPRLFSADDVDAAIDEMGEAFDIKRTDLDRLLAEIESKSRMRRGGIAGR